MVFLLLLVLCTTLPTYFMWSHTIYGNEKQSPKPIHDSVFKKFPRYFTNCLQSGVRDRVSRQTVIPFVWVASDECLQLLDTVTKYSSALFHRRLRQASQQPRRVRSFGSSCNASSSLSSRASVSFLLLSGTRQGLDWAI